MVVSIGRMFILGFMHLLGFFCEISSSATILEVDAELIEKFKIEAPLAWKRVRDAQMNMFASSGFEANIRSKIWKASRANDGDRIQSFEETVTRIDNSYRTYLRVESDGPDTLIVLNPFYSFELIRASTDSSWTLSQVFPANNDDNSIATEPSGYFHKRALSTPEQGNFQNIANLHPVHSALDELEMDDLDIRNAAIVSDNGRDLVRIEFGSPFEVYVVDQTTQVTEKQVQIADAYVVLDPSLEWAVLEFVAWSGPVKSSATKWSAKYEYDRTPSGVLYRSSSLHEYYYSDVKARSESFAVNCRNVPLNSNEFLLTKYGFPEPDYYTPPRPWWVYITITGMIIVVIGAVVLQMRRG